MASSDSGDLRAYFQRLTDEALADLHAAGAESYTPEAWALLDKEFQARNMLAKSRGPSADSARSQDETAMSELEDEALELVTVFASGDSVRLLMAKMALEGAGVPFLVKGEGIQDLLGVGRLFGAFNLATGPAQIQVRRTDLHEARDVLQDLEGSHPDDAAPHADGEDVPGTSG